MSRLLIFIPSPREITAFLNTIAQTKEDRLWVKYYPEEEAYNVARDWFLEHEEYSHLCILPDDLLVTPEQFNILKKDAEQYDVINGWCRNTIRLTSYYKGPPETEETAASNVSFILPPDPPQSGEYGMFQFISLGFIPMIKQDIIKVKFAGFPPTIISRKVIEKVPFRSDHGCCMDSCFSLDLDKAGMDQYCDLRVRTTHINASEKEYLLVGKREPHIRFEPARD